MKRRKNTIGKLVGGAAFVAAITLLNRFLQKNENPMVKRGEDEKTLSRKLSIVNIAYHLIGVFYNE